MVLPNLPQEIIADILTRLPVKSLLRFRCVCKPWLSLIDAPQFIKSHLNFSIHNNNHSMACVFHSPLAIYSCLLDSAMHEVSPVKSTLLDLPLDGIRDRVDLVGSCNGLICISISTLPKCVILWNPSTKKSIKLPPLEALPLSYVINGFGYDELNDDYKFVQIFRSEIRSFNSENLVNVYSLRTNAWRSIKVSGLFLPVRAGKFAHGALHWQVQQSDGLNSFWSISSFDLASETMQTIDLPNPKDTDANLDLGILGGCLCLCCEYYPDRLDLWILENGLKESWTKLVSIPYSGNPICAVSPLFAWENGEILLICGGSRFVFYNTKDKTFYYPDIRMRCVTGHFNEIEACIYVESLVSPNTGREGWSLELGPTDIEGESYPTSDQLIKP